MLLIAEHIGHGEASQDYIGDEKIKLKFNQGDNLTIVGISDEFFLARAENSDIGLVAKRFIKRERITGKPEVDVCGRIFELSQNCTLNFSSLFYGENGLKKNQVDHQIERFID